MFHMTRATAPGKRGYGHAKRQHRQPAQQCRRRIQQQLRQLQRKPLPFTSLLSYSVTSGFIWRVARVPGEVSTTTEAGWPRCLAFGHLGDHLNRRSYLKSYTDSVMGNWSYSYDNLNRLVASQNTAATPTSTQYANNYGCWSYDPFGNRTAQSLQTSPCPAQSASTWVYAANNNRVTGVIAPGGTQPSPSPLTYDQAGNVQIDTGAGNQYLYDGEGRICAVSSPSGLGGTVLTGYFYDAAGTRVAKGSLTSFSCNFAANGFKPTTSYVLGAGGEQLTELSVSGAPGNYTSAWTHTNAFSGGHITATYAWSNTAHTSTDTYFYLADWLGTKRAEVGAGGCLSTFASLPYGDGLAPSGNCPDATEHHFTGKERDTESGNDYFSARYYASSMGRFMSPDPGPYVWSDPQTLNRYAYTRDNPLKFIDPTGKYFVVAAQDQKFYQKALTDLYQRPGGRDLVNSLANSNRPVLLDRHSLDTANTGLAGQTTPLAVSGEPGVVGAHVTVGTDADLMAGSKMAPGKVSSDVTTGHELEHANDDITQGATNLQKGIAAGVAGDASTPGGNNTIGGTAQARAEEIMGEKTDMSRKDAGAAVQDILKSGQQQWKNDTNKSDICSQNQGACH
jgi:RHS repeat-associated protein